MMCSSCAFNVFAVTKCHCKVCQNWTGAPYQWMVLFPANKASVVKGAESILITRTSDALDRARCKASMHRPKPGLWETEAGRKLRSLNLPALWWFRAIQATVEMVPGGACVWLRLGGGCLRLRTAVAGAGSVHESRLSAQRSLPDLKDCPPRQTVPYTSRGWVGFLLFSWPLFCEHACVQQSSAVLSTSVVGGRWKGGVPSPDVVRWPYSCRVVGPVAFRVRYSIKTSTLSLWDVGG